MHNIQPELLQRLEEKFKSIGQNPSTHVEGLIWAKPITYWDYIQVDTLLTLQNPKTDYPDEKIFIVYHQITELYFNLALHEYEQIAHNGKNILSNGKDAGWKNEMEIDFFIERLNRISRYFESLTKSFEIMVDGMDQQQFLRYRLALLPASGFQSAQYRLIEICSTDFVNLIDKEVLLHEDAHNMTLMDHIASRGQLDLLDPKWINGNIILNKKEGPILDSIVIYSQDHKCTKQLKRVLKALSASELEKILECKLYPEQTDILIEKELKRQKAIESLSKNLGKKTKEISIY
jgi:tryptophan 2,3-dioxygenase